jgi:hypothetical protein
VFAPAGRNYKQRFKKGIADGTSKCFDLYNHKVTGEGKTAEYYCASDVTKNNTTQWFVHVGKDPDKPTIKKRIKTLLQTWKEYRKNPTKHFNTIFSVSRLNEQVHNDIFDA